MDFSIFFPLFQWIFEYFFHFFNDFLSIFSTFSITGKNNEDEDDSQIDIVNQITVPMIDSILQNK